jgi:apolipoprotein N-acyltransferase
MTRMRAAELGLPLIHAAVTGKSVVVGADGAFLSEMSELGTEEIVYAELTTASPGLYAATGDVLMWVAVLAMLVTWWRQRTLVASPAREEE